MLRTIHPTHRFIARRSDQFCTHFRETEKNPGLRAVFRVAFTSTYPRSEYNFVEKEITAEISRDFVVEYLTRVVDASDRRKNRSRVLIIQATIYSESLGRSERAEPRAGGRRENIRQSRCCRYETFTGFITLNFHFCCCVVLRFVRLLFVLVLREFFLALPVFLLLPLLCLCLFCLFFHLLQVSRRLSC